MTKTKTILISAGIVALAIIVLFFSGIFKKEKTPATDHLTKEFHSKYGFTLQYPEDWIIDESRSEAPAEFIREPNGRAFYSMQAHTDPRVLNPSELEKVYQDIENSFKNDVRYLVEESDWEHEEKDTADNSYFAAGSYTEDGKNWRFKEITIFSKSGNVLVLRGMSRKEYADEYGPMIDKIFFSVVTNEGKTSLYVTSKVAKEQALATVKNLPEVQEFVRLLLPKRAEFEVEDWDTDWAVHVFELIIGENSTHTATFGWYRVDKQTGAVTKE